MRGFGKWMIQGACGGWVSANKDQVDALAEHGVIHPCPSGEPHWHTRHGLASKDLQTILAEAHPDLMACDFCGTTGADWLYPTLPHTITVGGVAAAHTKGIPTLSCDACSAYVEEGRREALFHRIADIAIGRILDGTSHMPDDMQASVRKDIERDGFEPVLAEALSQAREVHASFFEHRGGDRVAFDGGRGFAVAGVAHGET